MVAEGHLRTSGWRPAGLVPGIPVAAGIGLRHAHFDELTERLPSVAWLEVHGENFFAAGGPPLDYLRGVREHYPLSVHCVGLSLGSTDPLDTRHVQALAGVIEQFEPGLVSDHLCWSSAGGRHLHDLLPLPYTEEALAHVVARIEAVQEQLGCTILVENVSSYLRYKHSTIPEWEFIGAVAERSGCGILLDVNNIYVSARNHGFDPLDYVQGVPAAAVGEIHLAGHAVNRIGTREVYIDDHGDRVAESVWSLYGQTLEQLGPRPVLVEWDTRLPALDTLLAEAVRAQSYLNDRAA